MQPRVLDATCPQKTACQEWQQEDCGRKERRSQCLNQRALDKHRTAIDLIVEYEAASSATEAMKAEIQVRGKCEYLSQKPTVIQFLQKALADFPPGYDASTWLKTNEDGDIMPAGV